MCHATDCVLLTAFAIALPAQQERALGYEELLGRMGDVEWMWQAPRQGERCVQFSSYDRRSHAGPGDFEQWYANDDRGKYLRVEERSGEKEYVMVDWAGPGVLSRIWSANPSGDLFFYVDGELAWTVDFKALLSGEIDPIGEPLAGMRARGGNCYLPIPFQKHLKVTASSNDFYYQCNVMRFAPGTTVPSFSPALLQANAAAVANALVMPPPLDVFPSEASRVAVPEGSIVREVLVWPQVVEGHEPRDLGEVLRRVLLVVRCGDEETVRVPVADFFAAGSGWPSWSSQMLEVRDTFAECRWPMPMPEGGVVELVTEGDLEGVKLHLWVQSVPLPADAGSPLLFRASYHQRKNFASRPFHDFTILDAKGAGRFVGCSLLVKNPTRAWWGEGDEKFWVDGEDFPSTFGTGTEDYFGYAWCCPEPFQSAFHAQTQCDGPGNYGFTALHRTQILDSVPFQRSFRFDLEVWHWVEGLKLDYASVAYWYGAPGATSGLPAVPPAAERSLDALPQAPVFAAEGVLEGEDLRVVAMTGGEHEKQDLSFRENTFSRDAHRWWKHGVPGDTLVLAVPVPEAGSYRVLGAFCMASDYGIVQLTLDDQKLGEPFDAFATGVQTSGLRELGVVELGAGDAMLRITILGANEAAHPAHMFGLDYLKLEKLP